MALSEIAVLSRSEYNCTRKDKFCEFASMYNSPYVGEQVLLKARNVSLHWFSIFGMVTCIVGIISSTTNLLILLAYYRVYRTRSKRIRNLPLLSLSASNIGMCGSNIPLAVWSCFNSGWPFSVEVCRWQAFFGGLFAFGQIGSLCLMAAQRGQSFSSTEIYNPALKTQVMSMSFVWLLAGMLAGMPFLGIGGYVMDGIMLSCSFNYVEQAPGNVAHMVFMMAFGFIGPLLWISFCFARIIRKTRKHFFESSPTPKGRSNDERRMSSRKQEIVITRCAAKCVVCFLTAWTPYAVISTFCLVTGRHVHPALPSMASVVAKCSTALNVLVYVGDIPVFYRKLEILFGTQKIKGKGL